MVSNDLNNDQRMLRICNSLAKNHYRVTLIGRKLKDSRPLTPENYEQKRLKCFFNNSVLFYAEYNIRLLLLLFVTKYDGICAIDLDTILPVALISYVKPRVTFYDAHEYFTEVPELVARPSVQNIWKTIEKFAVPKMNYCYTVCGSLSQLFENEYGIKFYTIKNVPFRLRAKSLTDVPKVKKIILYQGALNVGRGLESVITAMQFVENAELHLAGKGDIEQQLKELASRLNVTDKVIFLGNIAPVALKTITATASIGLNLLENLGLNYYFSLANKTFDYIQAGVPSLNMDFPEYRKLNSEFEISLLLNNLSPSTVAQNINALLNDVTLYNRLKINCLEAAKIWNWESEEQKLIQIYDNAFKKIKK